MGFRDLFKPDYKAQAAAEAHEARRVARMKGTSSRVNAGRSIPKAEQPHTCGRTCRPGYSCPSTVRGGVCPCRDC